MRVIAHGGAGSPPDEPADRQAVLDEAVDAGEAAETPLDAVCETVRVLEVDPQFNAGVGSAVQSDGGIRTDAGLMRSACDRPGGTPSERRTADAREAGAVCSLPGVAHAVSAARLVLTETPHVLLAGERAVAFAAEHGVETGVDCWTDATSERWADADPPAGGPAEQLAWLRERFGGVDAGGDRDAAADGGDGESVDPPPDDHDTVGAVACDGEAVAAATSTGGRWFALAGRVGDVPQVGAGFYAAPAGAASATGAGEAIARHTLSREAVRHLERGADAPTAARMAIGAFDDATGDSAGLIVMDAEGTAGEAYSSAAMQTARSDGA